MKSDDYDNRMDVVKDQGGKVIAVIVLCALIMNSLSSSYKMRQKIKRTITNLRSQLGSKISLAVI